MTSQFAADAHMLCCLTTNQPDAVWLEYQPSLWMPRDVIVLAPGSAFERGVSITMLSQNPSHAGIARLHAHLREMYKTCPVRDATTAMFLCVRCGATKIPLEPGKRTPPICRVCADDDTAQECVGCGVTVYDDPVAEPLCMGCYQEFDDSAST